VNSARPTLLAYNPQRRATQSSKAIKTLEFLIQVHDTFVRVDSSFHLTQRRKDELLEN
jgi:hypothetical protein